MRGFAHFAHSVTVIPHSAAEQCSVSCIAPTALLQFTGRCLMLAQKLTQLPQCCRWCGAVAEQLSCLTGSSGDGRELGRTDRAHPVKESEGISGEATHSHK